MESTRWYQHSNSPTFRELPAPRKLKDGSLSIETWSGLWHLDKNGQIDYEAVRAFTTGHCHSFALAVNELTGWPIYASILNKEFDAYDSPSHVFNKSPKGFVDVEGFIGNTHWIKQATVYKVTPEEIKKFVDYLKPRPNIALPYAKTMINDLHIKGVQLA